MRLCWGGHARADLTQVPCPEPTRPVTAALELSCPEPSTCWRHNTLPALPLAVSVGHMCPRHHSQRSISPLAKRTSCGRSPGTGSSVTKLTPPASSVEQLKNLIPHWKDKTCFQKECENTPRTGLCHQGLSPQSTTEGPTSSQPSPCCVLGWKGSPGAGLRTQMRGRGTDPAMPQCHPRGHGQHRKARHESPCTATTCKHLDTYVHTQTHTHTKKDPDIQRRKDMDVLKIAQNPQSPNLRNAKSPMSGDKTTAQEQATGSLGQKALGQGTQHPVLPRTGRWHAATGTSRLLGDGHGPGC